MDLVDSLLERMTVLLKQGWCRHNLAECEGAWCLFNEQRATAWSLQGALERAEYELISTHGASAGRAARDAAARALQAAAGDLNLVRWGEQPSLRLFDVLGIVSTARRAVVHARRAA